MVNYLRLYLCALVIFSSVKQVLANDQIRQATGQTVDVATLDVAGIRKGMSGKEVIEQLTKKYGPVSNADYRLPKDSKKNKLIISYDSKFGGVDIEKYVRSVDLYGPDFQINVYFLPNPDLDGTESVTRVLYKYNVPITPENLINFQSVLLEKYGHPSVMDVFIASWCAVNPIPNTTLVLCQNDGNALNYSISGTSISISWAPLLLNELEMAVRRKKIAKKPQL